MSSRSLLEFREAVFNQGYEGILVDEVHYYRNWLQDLKALYDSYPKKIIWASDSSSAVLKEGAYDLSRRFINTNVPLLSFREYVHLRTGIKIEPFDPFNSGKEKFASVLAKSDLNILALFRSYVSEGMRPIFLEANYAERITAIIEKTIHSDIPYIVEDLKSTHLMVMSAIIRALVVNPVPTLNIESMCKEWGLGKEKLYTLLYAMEAIGLISMVKKKSDQAAYSKGAKIFMSDPSVYSVFDGNLGSKREALVHFFLKGIGMNVFASKDETEGDFVTDLYTLEVGGRTKKPKKADFVIRDDLDVPSKGIIPLWSLGMIL